MTTVRVRLISIGGVARRAVATLLVAETIFLGASSGVSALAATTNDMGASNSDDCAILRHLPFPSAVDAFFRIQAEHLDGFAADDFHRLLRVVIEKTVEEFGLDVVVGSEEEWDATDTLDLTRDALERQGKTLALTMDIGTDTEGWRLNNFAVADLEFFAELPPTTDKDANGIGYSIRRPVRVHLVKRLMPDPRHAIRFDSAAGTMLRNNRDPADSIILINTRPIQWTLEHYGIPTEPHLVHEVEAVMFNELAHYLSLTEMTKAFRPETFSDTVLVRIGGKPTPFTVQQINELFSDYMMLTRAKPHPVLYFSNRMLDTDYEPYGLIHMATRSAFNRTLHDLMASQPEQYEKLLRVRRGFDRAARGEASSADAMRVTRDFAALVGGDASLFDGLLNHARDEVDKLFQACWHELSVKYSLGTMGKPDDEPNSPDDPQPDD